MSRSFAFLAAATVTGTLAVASSAAPQTQQGLHRSFVRPVSARVAGTALSTAEIQANFVGNTIDGVENGEAYSEYIAPDGTIRGVEPDGFYSGAWRIANGQICFHYNDDDDASTTWDCWPVTLVGENVYWSSGLADGDSPEATLLKGNPKNL